MLIPIYEYIIVERECDGYKKILGTSVDVSDFNLKKMKQQKLSIFNVKQNECSQCFHAILKNSGVYYYKCNLDDFVNYFSEKGYRINTKITKIMTEIKKEKERKYLFTIEKIES